MYENCFGCSVFSFVCSFVQLPSVRSFVLLPSVRSVAFRSLCCILLCLVCVPFVSRSSKATFLGVGLPPGLDQGREEFRIVVAVSELVRRFGKAHKYRGDGARDDAEQDLAAGTPQEGTEEKGRHRPEGSQHEETQQYTDKAGDDTDQDGHYCQRSGYELIVDDDGPTPRLEKSRYLLPRGPVIVAVQSNVHKGPGVEILQEALEGVHDVLQQAKQEVRPFDSSLAPPLVLLPSPKTNDELQDLQKSDQQAPETNASETVKGAADAGIVNGGAASAATTQDSGISEGRWRSGFDRVVPPGSDNTGNGRVEDVLHYLDGPKIAQEHPEADEFPPRRHEASIGGGIVVTAALTVVHPSKIKDGEFHNRTAPEKDPNI
mmetsp:Transcript_16164/g.33202  ORF Transcript_16164/g.33202 Transcript_16164/m.33202 type:complete len:375 (-) Transcript_16164:970-2094(-)